MNYIKNWNLTIVLNDICKTRISPKTPKFSWIINISKKRTQLLVNFAVPGDHRVKSKGSEKKEKYLDLTREQKNYGTWNWRWYQLYFGRSERSLKLGKETGRVENQRMSQNYPNYSIVKIGLNTEESPRDLS